MIHRRELLIAVIGTLVLTSVTYADMISLFRVDTGRRQSSLVVCDRTDLHYTNLFSPSVFPSAANLDSWSVEFSLEANADVSQTSEMQHPQILTNGPGSLSLCLYALMGLGLCSSAHFVKRLSFGFVPEWYHNGGPFQIGHSFAVSTESLCPAPVYCFNQPVCKVEDSLPQYRLRTVVSLWRKSQFTPVVIASRGPPPVLQA